MEKKKECPACGERNATARQTCSVCGPETPVVEGKKIDPKTFHDECPACGANISKERPQCPICSFRPEA